MSIRAIGASALLAGTLLASPTPAVPKPWIEASPADPAETALRQALSANAFGGPLATAAALRQVSAAHPGTPASGLAQLAAGLLLLETGKPAEALPCLRHPDVARIALADHVERALAAAEEATGDAAAAGPGYLAAADARPGGPIACTALFLAADAFAKALRPEPAVAALERSLTDCPDQAPRALLRLGQIQEGRGERKAAADAYDRLDADYPASPEGGEAGRRLRVLARELPPLPPEARRARDLKRALALFDAGRYRDAAAALRAALAARPTAEDAALARLRFGEALARMRRFADAERELAAVAADSSSAAEAAFELARCRARRTRKPDGYEEVARRFPGTAWGEEALLALANHYQKDARDEDALPYYERMVAEYPEGRYIDRATWHVAWAEYRGGRFEEAALALERAARLRPDSLATPGFLYWAGRARHALGQDDRARQLLEEVQQRFKYAYYGMRSADVLRRLPPAPAAAPGPILRGDAAGAPDQELPEPQATRVRQLLLVDRLDEARSELLTAPPGPVVEATLAWIEWRRGRLRLAINAMRLAHPEYVSAAGDQLPAEVWQILYPLEYPGLLQQKAAAEGLDPALVAALIWQESTFDPGAVSPAGARGLMQIVPRTGRTLARVLRVRYSTRALHDPAVSLDMGTRYLRLMLDRFGGRIERALAAYNAGPDRVEAWTAGRPDVGAEEFIESIPFTETRRYVTSILAVQEQYRRLYSLQAAAPAGQAAPAGPRS